MLTLEEIERLWMELRSENISWERRMAIAHLLEPLTERDASLRAENERLREALASVIKQTEDWNDAVEKIIGRFPHTGIDLDRARAALQSKGE
jgi:3-methyladenine DNA glycosylase AlkD